MALLELVLTYTMWVNLMSNGSCKHGVLAWEASVLHHMQTCFYYLKSKFLASLEDKVRSKILLWRRFLDDIFILWTGTKDELEDFMCQINGFHETIKFTKDGDLERRSRH